MIEDGISFIDVKINNQIVTLIAVYLINNSSKIELQIRKKNQLNIVNQIITQKREEAKEFIILGDFNGDIHRCRYTHDVNLVNFIKKFAIRDIISTQKISTYEKGETQSCLDNVMV